jgi:tetratricopeptide (TPR) repeat protein
MMKYMKEMAVVLLILFGSCTKFLEAVPDSGLTVPKTVADFQQLLEQDIMSNNSPGIGEFGTDDIYLPDPVLATQTVELRNGYIWAKDIYEGATSGHWNTAYRKIYNANIVLEGTESIQKNNTDEKDVKLIKGWALFCRANAFFDLAQVYAPAYRAGTATVDLGIPLRLNSKLTEKTARATVAETYHQILSDLDLAITLLPAEVFKTNRSKPGKATAYALRARVYLNMQQYEAALTSADESLKLYNQLLDYNLVTPSTGLSFSPVIDEVLYLSMQISTSTRNWQIDQALYNAYENNDLRRSLFFSTNATTGAITFKGFYSTLFTGFNGLATDEIYLIKAECLSRLNQPSAALETLNALLLKRYRKGSYIPYTLSNTSEVLKLILLERRKECVFRNLRWSDLRRLNLDPQYAKTLTRTANGTKYQLLPNDPRYVLPIADDEIRSSGIEQNVR